jgi:hypothetical protein
MSVILCDESMSLIKFVQIWLIFIFHMSNFILLVWKVYICIYTFYDESVVTVQICLIYIFRKKQEHN